MVNKKLGEILLMKSGNYRNQRRILLPGAGIGSNFIFPAKPFLFSGEMPPEILIVKREKERRLVFSSEISLRALTEAAPYPS